MVGIPAHIAVLYAVEPLPRAWHGNKQQNRDTVFGIPHDLMCLNTWHVSYTDVRKQLFAMQGGCRACNRIGIESSTSVFLKISFETAAHFLTDATMKGTTDDLTSPASRLVVGRVVEMGTGCFDLVQYLNIDQSVS